MLLRADHFCERLQSPRAAGQCDVNLHSLTHCERLRWYGINILVASNLDMSQTFNNTCVVEEGNPEGGKGLPLSSPSTNHTRGLAARRLFRVPPCRKGTIHLQASMSSPGFESSPYGITVSVANHYAGWATYFCR
ncbi:hypothetical protein TNCV_251601 [Trichonephila clavipes]|nr:hypothetical protein TNCV_251601 [Trichonephila clavipes]